MFGDSQAYGNCAHKAANPKPAVIRMGTQVYEKKLVSVVLSFRNEEEVIPELLRRLHKVAKSLPINYELIFVNDDSTDRSLELLMKHQEQDKNIKIINMSRKFGIAPCVMAGFRHAKGDAVIYMDADLQDPPELIPTLLQKWKEGADVVHTTRTKRRGENAFKAWLTKQAYKAINFMADIDVPENAGDFKLLSRRVVDKVAQLKEYDPFMRGLVRWVGFKQVQVFYEREPRFAGKTHFSLWRSINPEKEFIRGITSFSAVPLYFALVMGFAISLGALVYLIYIIITKPMVTHLPGLPASMVVMLFLVGTILFTIGILGIYVGRIHHDIKNRPDYIIESTIGFGEDL